MNSNVFFSSKIMKGLHLPFPSMLTTASFTSEERLHVFKQKQTLHKSKSSTSQQSSILAKEISSEPIPLLGKDVLNPTPPTVERPEVMRTSFPMVRWPFSTAPSYRYMENSVAKADWFPKLHLH